VTTKLGKRGAVLVLGVLLAAGLAGGCVTADQGEKFQGSIDDLVNRVTTLEKANRDLKAQFDVTNTARGDLVANVQALQGELRELRGAVEDAMFQVDKVKKATGEAQPELQTTLTDLQARLAAVEAKLGIQPGQQALPPIPGDGGKTPPPVKGQTDKQLYEQAVAAYKAKQVEPARQGFRSLLKAFPKSKLAGAAQFWIAETYYGARDFENAILEYDKVVSQYPNSTRSPART
jgi:TolA-binding protein